MEEQKILFGAVEVPLGLPSKVIEHSRTADMLKALETKYGDQYDISLFSDSSN